MEMPHPGLKTRTKNKDIHPADNAGVGKKTRRSSAQVQQARDDQETARNKDKVELNKKMCLLAALEDKQQKEDVAYAKNTNHPPNRTPKTVAAAKGVDVDDDQSLSQGPTPSERGDSDGEQYEPQDSDDDEPPKQKKKPKKPGLSCADIIASRETRDESGTPATICGKKRKADKEKKGGKAKKTKSNDKRSGLISLIAIQPGAPKGLTRKQVCGGAAKWSLKHLAANTTDQFTNKVVPLARKLLNTAGDKPWGKLTVPQIQAIVDKVYGKGCHAVTPNGLWVSLTGYHLDSWHNGLGAQLHKYMLDIIHLYESDKEEDAKEGSGDDMDTSADASVDAANAPTGSPKPPKFKLNAPEGRATFVEWCLQTAPGGGTFAFHWKTWGNGVDKKGFLQSHIILHALAYHLTCLEAIPGGYECLGAHPESALLLATQVVHHELQFWRSGEYFVQTADGKKKQKRTWRATKFLLTIRGWDDDHWKEIIQAARKVEDDPVLSDDDDVVLSD
ncbi:hypothetical protein K438DRAFT_1966434 [Mycena galopus ATCC 62051]|nr:hypothetical protein K438DRAFT_1966434 [Mycena galopus ATCC 62051]